MCRMKSKNGDSLALAGSSAHLRSIGSGSVCHGCWLKWAEVDAGCPAAGHISVWITPIRHRLAHQTQAARLDPSSLHGPQTSSQAPSLHSDQEARKYEQTQLMTEA